MISTPCATLLVNSTVWYVALGKRNSLPAVYVGVLQKPLNVYNSTARIKRPLHAAQNINLRHCFTSQYEAVKEQRRRTTSVIARAAALLVRTEETLHELNAASRAKTRSK